VRGGGHRSLLPGAREARAMEPVLSPKVIAAFAVPDATIDPFRLA
jgi:glycerol-3-phosphate dehydrogenase